MDGTRKTLSSTSSRQNNCARDSHSKSRELLACLWRLDLTFSSILSVSLCLSLCACSGSLHLGFVAFSACSQIFVWRVCLWGGASCSWGFIEFPTCWQSFSQKLVCEVEVAFEVLLHWPMCWQSFVWKARSEVYTLTYLPQLPYRRWSLLPYSLWSIISKKACLSIPWGASAWVWEGQPVTNWDCCQTICFHKVWYGIFKILCFILVWCILPYVYIYIWWMNFPPELQFWFISFLPCADTFIQKTRKLYLDTRTQRNLSKLNDDLFEVQQIMTRNIQEVLGVGDRLDRMSLTRKSNHGFCTDGVKVLLVKLGFACHFSRWKQQ